MASRFSLRELNLSIKEYATGTTYKVSNVDTNTPPIKVTAIGLKVSDPAPVAKAEGTAAAIVAAEVIIIGRKRTGQASIKAATASVVPRERTEAKRRPGPHPSVCGQEPERPIQLPDHGLPLSAQPVGAR